MRSGWLFLAAVLDLFSRKIVGWSMGERLTSELAQSALSHAIQARAPKAGVLVHSDRGKEYYAGNYQTLLASYGLTCSMSRKGNCWDNAPMESFFHSLKVEQVTVRAGKGNKDRVTLLPESLIPALRNYLIKVAQLHKTDLLKGNGNVPMPNAFYRKYPSASKMLAWQYVFPSTTVRPW